MYTIICDFVTRIHYWHPPRRVNQGHHYVKVFIDSRPVLFHLSIVQHGKNGRAWIPRGSMSVKSHFPQHWTNLAVGEYLHRDPGRRPQKGWPEIVDSCHAGLLVGRKAQYKLEDSVHAVFNFQWELYSSPLCFNVCCCVISHSLELPTPLGLLKREMNLEMPVPWSVAVDEWWLACSSPRRETGAAHSPSHCATPLRHWRSRTKNECIFFNLECFLKSNLSKRSKKH